MSPQHQILLGVHALGAAVCAWHWRRCYRRRWIWFKLKKAYRDTNAFEYWLSMSVLAYFGFYSVAIAVFLLVVQ